VRSKKQISDQFSRECLNNRSEIPNFKSRVVSQFAAVENKEKRKESIHKL